MMDGQFHMNVRFKYAIVSVERGVKLMPKCPIECHNSNVFRQLFFIYTTRPCRISTYFGVFLIHIHQATVNNMKKVTVAHIFHNF